MLEKQLSADAVFQLRMAFERSSENQPKLMSEKEAKPHKPAETIDTLMADTASPLHPYAKMLDLLRPFRVVRKKVGRCHSLSAQGIRLSFSLVGVCVFLFPSHENAWGQTLVLVLSLLLFFLDVSRRALGRAGRAVDAGL